MKRIADPKTIQFSYDDKTIIDHNNGTIYHRSVC